jgi:hypothetical protein
MAYYQLEPFGDERLARLEILTGQLLTFTANINRRKGSRALKLEDVMPWIRIERPQRGWEQHLQMAEALNAMFGGEDRRPSTNVDTNTRMVE